MRVRETDNMEWGWGTIASKINVTPKCVWLSEKLHLTAGVCNEIWPQWKNWLMLLWASKFATAKIDFVQSQQHKFTSIYQKPF